MNHARVVALVGIVFALTFADQRVAAQALPMPEHERERVTAQQIREQVNRYLKPDSHVRGMADGELCRCFQEMRLPKTDIRGTLVQSKDDRYFVLNAGNREGVETGMEFVTFGEDAPVRLRILRVGGRNESLGEVLGEVISMIGDEVRVRRDRIRVLPWPPHKIGGITWRSYDRILDHVIS